MYSVVSERVPDYPKTRTEKVLPEGTRGCFSTSGNTRNRTETNSITRGYPKKVFLPMSTTNLLEITKKFL